MQLIYLHDLSKLNDRSLNIPLEEERVQVCWFRNSENIVVANEKGFQIFNVLKPDVPVISVKYELKNSIVPPKISFDD